MNDKMVFSHHGRKSAASGVIRPMAAAATAALLLSLTAGMVSLAPVTPVLAQASGTPADVPAVVPAYKIGIDDQIEVSVVDHNDATRTYIVPSDGVIEPQMGGDINVIGMTVSDLRAKLTRAYSKKYYQPQVIVNVHPALQTVNAFVVNHGSKYPLKQGDRLLSVIAAAGGLPYQRPEAFTGKLYRASTGQVVPIDVEKLYANDPNQNVEIFSGDTIVIEEKEARDTTIQVLGEVQKPGPVLYPRDQSIVTVLQAAGGPTPAAALSRVTVDHNGQQTIVDMRDFKVKGFEPATKLLPGDKLIVPENKNEYYIAGEGERTGAQLYPDDKKLTVYTAFTTNGATTSGVDLRKVKLLHPLANNTTQTTVIDLQKMLDTGNFAQDKPVEPGDTVYFPPTKSRKGLSATEAIGLFSGIVGVIYTLQILRRH